MSDTFDQQKRAVAGGIWSFIGDLVFWGYGFALVYFVGGLMLVGIFTACEWLLGPELGWQVGFWIVILGSAIIEIMALVTWQKQELRRREAELRRCREDLDRIVRG